MTTTNKSTKARAVREALRELDRLDQRVADERDLLVSHITELNRQGGNGRSIRQFELDVVRDLALSLHQASYRLSSHCRSMKPLAGVSQKHDKKKEQEEVEVG